MSSTTLDTTLAKNSAACAMEDQASRSVLGESEMSLYRKMMITPALKILNDPDHSEKSLYVLIGVMERCCKDEKKQGVFLGSDQDEHQRKLAFCK